MTITMINHNSDKKKGNFFYHKAFVNKRFVVLIMNFKNRTQQLETEFSKFDDWEDKYNYLIELGQSLPIIDEKYKQPQYLIEGCQSRVWLYADFREGKVFYTADSDAIITKGIASLIIRAFNGLTPDEILTADLSAFDRIGLKEHLSPTRSNGMVSMMKQIQLYAMAFKIKNVGTGKFRTFAPSKK